MTLPVSAAADGLSGSSCVGTVIRADAQVRLAQLLQQPREHVAREHRQAVLCILEDTGQFAPQPPHCFANRLSVVGIVLCALAVCHITYCVAMSFTVCPNLVSSRAQ